MAQPRSRHPEVLELRAGSLVPVRGRGDGAETRVDLDADRTSGIVRDPDPRRLDPFVRSADLEGCQAAPDVDGGQ